MWNCREAAVPEKETKMWENGTHSNRGLLNPKMKAWYQTFQMRYSSFLRYAQLQRLTFENYQIFRKFANKKPMLISVEKSSISH